MKKIILYTLLGLIILAYPIYYYLFQANQKPTGAAHPYDLKIAEQLIADDSESLPSALNASPVAIARVPEALVLAGGSLFEKHDIYYFSFQIAYENKKTVIVDAIHDKEMHEKFYSDTEYNQDNYDRMQKAMLSAEKIVFSHEHWDHIAGISRSPYFDQIKDKVIFTEEQHASRFDLKLAEFPEEFVESYKPVKYKEYERIAPGVVAIKAPGHANGNLMYYIKLKNGKRILFTSCIVWSEIGITQPITRPNLISLIFQEKRDFTNSQILWLHKLYKKNDGLSFIVAHDGPMVLELMDKKIIGSEFTLPE